MWWSILIIIIVMVIIGNCINDKECQQSGKCPSCNGSGTGMEMYEPCSRCGGTGKY